MAISVWHLVSRVRARSRWIDRVERLAADCLPHVWPHITSAVRSMSGNEAHGYLRAHASLHVSRRIPAHERSIQEAVIDRVVQLLELRVHQPVPVYATRRAA